MRFICISPHLDDAVLSIGGLIHAYKRAGQEVEIWTIMSGFPPPGELSPLAQVLHYQWGTGSGEETIRIRRQEDDEAAKILGVRNRHFDFQDCIYRRAKSGEWLHANIFDPPHEEETELIMAIRGEIHSRVSAEDILIGPLAIGMHVDHLIVRRALEGLNRPVQYYPDLPYLFNHANELALRTPGLVRKVHSIGENDLDKWFKAVQAYRSQLSTVFDSLDRLWNCIREYREKWDGVSLWKVE